MIHLKKANEIRIMSEGGKKLRQVASELIPNIRSGMTTNKIDQEAEKLIKKVGGEPSFKKVNKYYWSTCLPINEQVVHTPPSDRILKPGDVLTVDIGLYYRGFHTDYATTIMVDGETDDQTKRFLETGKNALLQSIESVKVGNYIGDISITIEKEIYGHGYKILKNLTGHGIGRNLHEDPYIFGFRERPREKTPSIEVGLTIAIEVIYSIGSEEIKYENGNDWSVVTIDGSLSACFEHTVAVTNDQTIILT